MDVRSRSFRVDRSRVMLAGKPLSAYGLFLTDKGYSISEAKPQTTYLDVPGVSGGVNATTTTVGMATLGRRTVTLNVATVGTEYEIREAKYLISRWAGRRIGFSLDDYLQFGNGSNGWLTVGEWTDLVDSQGVIRSSSTTLTLDADPLFQGVYTRTSAIPAGVSTQIDYNGNVPVIPDLTFTTTDGSQMPTGTTLTVKYWTSKMTLSIPTATKDASFTGGDALFTQGCALDITSDYLWLSPQESILSEFAFESSYSKAQCVVGYVPLFA